MAGPGSADGVQVGAASDDGLSALLASDRSGQNLGDVVFALIALRVRQPAEFADLHAVMGRRMPSALFDRLLEFRHAGVQLAPELRRSPSDSVRISRLIDSVSRLSLPDAADLQACGRLALRILDLTSAGMSRKGDHYTPSSLVALMVALTRPGPDMRVHDPFCRAGELLVGAVISMAPHDGDMIPAVLSAGAAEARFLRLTAATMALAGVDSELELRDALTAGHDDTEEYDVVLANPPFGASVDSEAIRADDRRWQFGAPPRHNTNFAWLQHVLSILAENGRAAVLMPNNAATSEHPTERQIRKEMLRAGTVDSVIALPDRLFPSTPIALNLWLLRAPSTAAGSDVLFVDASGLGSVNRALRVLSLGDIARIVDVHGDRGRESSRGFAPEHGFAAAVPIVDLVDSQAGLNPRAYVTSTTRPTGTASLSFQLDQWRERRLASRGRARSLRIAVDHQLAVLDASRGPLSAVLRVQLGDVCALLAGPGRFEDHPHGTTYQVVTPRGIRQNRIVDGDVSRSLAPSRAARYLLEEGDVVCVRVGGLGRQGVVGPEEAGWLLGPGCLRLRPGPEVEPTFLVHQLGTSSSLDWLDRHATGSAIRGVSTGVLREMPLVLPSLDTQRRIGSLLGALDEEAEALRDAGSVSEQLGLALAEALIIGQ